MHSHAQLTATSDASDNRPVQLCTRVGSFARRRPHLVLRLFGGAFVIAAFAIAYFGVHQLGRDMSIAGLSDDQVRVIGHLLAFGTLGSVLGLSLGGRFVTAWVIVVVLAGVDEYLQSFVPNRWADFGDWVIDVVGCTAGVFITAAMWYLAPRPRLFTAPAATA